VCGLPRAQFYSECLAASHRKIKGENFRERQIVKGNLVFFAIIVPTLLGLIAWHNHVLGAYVNRDVLILTALTFVFLSLVFHFLWGRKVKISKLQDSSDLPKE
jgi:hypothetical protein